MKNIRYTNPSQQTEICYLNDSDKRTSELELGKALTDLEAAQHVAAKLYPGLFVEYID